MSFFLPSFAPIPPPSQPPVTTYVRVQPLQFHFLEWCIQIVLIYVVLRDFSMYLVPWITRVVLAWVHSTFPATEAVVDDVVDDAFEELDKFVAEQTTANRGVLEHAGEELLEAASKGATGLVQRLVTEAVS
jgi:hypothetical protein